MKPPFSYYGGKQRLASRIVELIPPHVSYIEPFAGSAAVMFRKGLPPNQTNTDHYREVLNDLRTEIVTFFRVLIDPDKAAYLRKMLEVTPYSADIFHEAGARLSDPPGRNSDAKLSWAWFVGQMQGFGGVGSESGWSRCKKIGANGAEIHANAVDRLHEYTERMRRVYVDNIDAVECIKKWDVDGAFFYVDPPYVGADQGCYSGFTEPDLARLLEALQNARGSFILSGYSHPMIDAYGWQRVDIVAYSSARRDADRENGKRTECLWIVDRSNEAPESIQRVARKIWAK